VYWRWTAHRLLVSTFLLGHLGATAIWVLPNCPIRQRACKYLDYYMTPTGMWQYWTMFAPDPVRDTVTLEAEITDAQGLRHVFAFPKMADYTALQGIPRFRYSKYTANLADDNDLSRRFAARHAVRRLALPDSAFPVEVYLMFQVRNTPPPGSPAPDPMTPAKPMVLASYQFAKPSEVRP
jgi:hypothetical protein